MIKYLLICILLLSCAPSIKQNVDTYMRGYCDGWDARDHNDTHAQMIIDSLKACQKSTQK